MAINNERPVSTHMERSTSLGDLSMCVCTYVSIFKGEEPGKKWTNGSHHVWHLYGEWMCGDSRKTWPFCFGMSPWFECLKMNSHTICVTKRLKLICMRIIIPIWRKIIYIHIYTQVSIFTDKVWKETHQCFYRNYKCVMRCEHNFSEFPTF